MTVRSILSGKGEDVFTLTTEQSLLEASKILADYKIGALVVSNEDREILGILSERDIVRRIASMGQEALSQTVGSCMTREVQTCTEDSTVTQLMTQMTQGRFRHLPVERDGKLIGIVSIGDVVKKRIADVEKEAEQIKEYISAI
jgi:CBS domain-containing protein